MDRKGPEKDPKRTRLHITTKMLEAQRIACRVAPRESHGSRVVSNEVVLRELFRLHALNLPMEEFSCLLFTPRGLWLLWKKKEVERNESLALMFGEKVCEICRASCLWHFSGDLTNKASRPDCCHQTHYPSCELSIVQRLFLASTVLR